MSKWQGSNLRSLVPKTSGLPTFLHLEVIVLINGLEPITSTVSGGCSNQLSYINIFLDPRTGIEPISSAYKAVASPTKLTRNLARVKGFEPLTTILETVMIPFHHTRIFVIPTRFELVTPSLKVRCSKPAELRDHFCACRWTRTTELRRGLLYRKLQLPLCDTGMCWGGEFRNLDLLLNRQLLFL